MGRERVPRHAQWRREVADDGGPGGGGFGGGGGGGHAAAAADSAVEDERRGASGDRGTGKKYNLTFTLSARNAFNHLNYGHRGGVDFAILWRIHHLGRAGPRGMFGGAGSAAGNRRIDLQLRLSF